MQNPTALDPINQLQAGNRPCLNSFDSSHDFSVDHWLEVKRLVERETEDTSGYVFEDSLLLHSK